MVRAAKTAPSNGVIVLFLVLLNAIAMREGYTGSAEWEMVFIVTIPLLLLAIANSITIKFINNEKNKQSVGP